MDELIISKNAGKKHYLLYYPEDTLFRFLSLLLSFSLINLNK